MTSLNRFFRGIVFTVFMVAGLSAGLSNASSADYDCTIFVYDSNVTVVGSDAADVICVFGDDNIIDGLAGNDVVVDEGLNNTIYLGPGDDLYDGSNGECAADGSGATVDGGDGDDTLIGTPCGDEMNGGGDDDSLIGGEGADVLDGGTGTDNLEGDAGPDELSGEAGLDFIDGGAGDDTIDGGAGDDSLIAGEGNDDVTGGDGDDYLSGDAGNDNLYGETGVDQLVGGAGDDIIVGGQDIDLLDGGVGLNLCDYTISEILTMTCTYDDDAPVLTHFELLPNTVDVSSARKQVRFKGSVNDATGIDRFSIWCGRSNISIVLEPANESYVGLSFDGSDYEAITSGVSFTDNGEILNFDILVGVRRGAAPGEFSCTFWGQDVLWNNQNQITNEKFTITREDGYYDDQAPRIFDLSLTPNIVDVTNSRKSVLVKGSVIDDTGVRGFSIQCGQSNISIVLNQTTLIAIGLSFDGTKYLDISNGVRVLNNGTAVDFEVEMGVRKGAIPGQFNCRFWREDILHNVSDSSVSAVLTVQRFGEDHDDLNPQLSDFSITPNYLDVGSSSKAAQVSGVVNDASGVWTFKIWCGHSNISVGINPENLQVDAWSTDGVNYFNISNDFEVLDLGETIQFRTNLPVRFGKAPSVDSCHFWSMDNLWNVGENLLHQELTVVRTPPGLPQAPSGLVFEPMVGRPSDGVLSWAAPEVLGSPELFDYEVQVSSDGATWVTLSDAVSRQTSVALGNLKTSSVYFFRVRGDNGGNSVLGSPGGTWSQPLRVVTPDPVVATAPIDVMVDGVTARGVNVRWFAPSYNGGVAITDYVVEVSRDAGVTWSTVPHAASASTSLSVSGLVPNSSYLVRVAAVNIAGVSASSQEVSFATPATTASAPLGLTSGDVTATGVVMSWDLPVSNGGSAITDYQVEVSRNSGVSWTVIPHDPFLSRSFTVSGLTRATTYLFRVSAVNSVGIGDVSSSVSVRTLATVSSSPRNLAVSRIQARSVHATWQTPADTGGSPITDYVVEVSRDAGVVWSAVPHTPSPVTSMTVSGLAPGTAYLLRVSAVNSVGVSGSVQSSFTTVASIPTAVSNIVASNVTKSSLTLTWDLPLSNGGSPIKDYQIEVSSNGTSFTKIPHTPSITRVFNVVNLKAGTRYWFRVAAINTLGVGELSPTHTLVTIGNPPAAPTGLAVRGSGTSVTLSWKAAIVNEGSSVRDYRIEFSTNNGATWVTVSKPKSTALSLKINNLKAKTKYTFRVYAFNDVGESPASKTISISTK